MDKQNPSKCRSTFFDEMIIVICKSEKYFSLLILILPGVFFLTPAFSEEDVSLLEVTPIRFESYPGVTFLLRKIGKDYDDDCNDNSLAALMNISRSGDAKDSNFKWERFVDPDNRNTQQLH